jgi:hypothetical protein
MSEYNNVPHTATIFSNKQKTTETRKIIAYRGKDLGNVYFPSLFGLKEIAIGIEGGKLRAFSSIGGSCRYEPVYEGDEEFTITIK